MAAQKNGDIGRGPQRIASIFAVVTPAGLPLCALTAFIGGPVQYLGLVVAAVLVGVTLGLGLALLIQIARATR